MLADGRLDLDSLDRVVDYYLECGASGLVPASIAGEGDRLEEGERQLVGQRVVERSRACGRGAPVVAAVLETDTEAALAQARAAAAWGVDGLLVKPPFGPARAMEDHFSAIGSTLRLPIILMDYPQEGPKLPPPLIARLIDAAPELCGIKLEDEPTAAKMACLRVRLGARLRIFGGLSGAHCLEELEQGADGFFTGCARPELLVSAMAGFRAGNRRAAAHACEALRHVVRRERADPGGWIAQRKAMLCELGVLRHATVRPRPAA
jgi:4-hydroxy-tetrahydrodipicolinate synthase